MQAQVAEHMVTHTVGSRHHVHETDDSIEAPDSAQVLKFEIVCLKLFKCFEN